MFDNFKVANYNNVLLSPEFYARPLSRLFTGEAIDGFTVIPGTGLQVVLEPGTAFVRFGSANIATARLVSLVDNFNLTITTADASNPRNDLVVLYVDNSVTLPGGPPTAANLDGPGVAKAIVVAGTPNANPADPTPAAIQAAIGSASYPYIILSRVRVDALASVIAPNKITDLRVRVSAMLADGVVTKSKLEKPHWTQLYYANPATGQVFGASEVTAAFSAAHPDSFGVTTTTGANANVLINRPGLYHITLMAICIDVSATSFITWFNYDSTGIGGSLIRNRFPDQVITDELGRSYHMDVYIEAGVKVSITFYNGAGSTRFGGTHQFYRNTSLTVSEVR